MASRTNRRQIAIVALIEGLVHMIADQGDHDNEYFRQMRLDVTEACNAAYPVLVADPNGGLTPRDTVRVMAAVDRLKERAFREFTAEQAVSFCISLLSDQITVAHNLKKKAAFGRILTAAENLYWYFDPEGKYDAPDGFRAACVFDALEV
jgi:hypothetical protein